LAPAWAAGASGAAPALSASGGTTASAGTTTSPPPEPAEVQAQERKTLRSFYGWEILAAGELGGLITVASVVLPEKPLGTPLSAVGFAIGAPTFAVAGPVVHWSHNQFDKGLVSLAGNIALPMIGGFVGRSVGCKGDDSSDCHERVFFRGLSLGAVVAPVLDAFLLGWEDLPVEDQTTTVAASSRSGAALRDSTRPRAEKPAKFSIAPTWAVGTCGEVTLGLFGKF
jgi:hypothetical protein